MGHVKWSVRVQEKPKNGQYVFGFLGRNIDALLLTGDFVMFSCPRRLWKLQFRSPKFIFGEILIKNIFLDFYDFVFCIFLHIHFLIFLTFANFVEKIILEGGN